MAMSESLKAAQKKYQASAKGKARTKKYKSTDAGKIAQKRAEDKFHSKSAVV